MKFTLRLIQTKKCMKSNGEISHYIQKFDLGTGKTDQWGQPIVECMVNFPTQQDFSDEVKDGLIEGESWTIQDLKATYDIKKRKFVDEKTGEEREATWMYHKKVDSELLEALLAEEVTEEEVEKAKV